MQGTIDELRDLGSPRGDEEEIEAIVTAMQEELDTAKSHRIITLIEFGEEFHKSDLQSAKYGLDGCTFSF